MLFIEATLLIWLRFFTQTLIWLTPADKCMATPAPLLYKSTRRDSDNIRKVKVPLLFGLE